MEQKYLSAPEREEEIFKRLISLIQRDMEAETKDNSPLSNKS